MPVKIVPTPVNLDGLRKPQRDRIRWALRRLLDTGLLNRKDISASGEVSIPQASIDIREIMARFPGAMAYDAHAKAYRPTAGAVEIITPALAEPEATP